MNNLCEVLGSAKHRREIIAYPAAEAAVTGSEHFIPGPMPICSFDSVAVGGFASALESG
jgi:hypothetical protein